MLLEPLSLIPADLALTHWVVIPILAAADFTSEYGPPAAGSTTSNSWGLPEHWAAAACKASGTVTGLPPSMTALGSPDHPSLLPDSPLQLADKHSDARGEPRPGQVDDSPVVQLGRLQQALARRDPPLPRVGSTCHCTTRTLQHGIRKNTPWDLATAFVAAHIGLGGMQGGTAGCSSLAAMINMSRCFLDGAGQCIMSRWNR